LILSAQEVNDALRLLSSADEGELDYVSCWHELARCTHSRVGLAASRGRILRCATLGLLERWDPSADDTVVGNDNVYSLLGPRDPGSVNYAEYEASLWIHSSTLKLAQLKARLGSPTWGRDSGELSSSHWPDNPVRKHARKHAAWKLESSRERSSLEPQIEELVAFVEARRELFTELLTCCRIEVACTVFRGDVEVPALLDTSVIVLGCGFELKPELLHRLADLRLGLSFSIY
jgi:Domain of unknown function (DUF4279)